MARQTYYVTREQRHPLYKTRMLTAGQSLELDASAARLFQQLGVDMTDQPPRRATQAELHQKTKAELARLAGLTPDQAKKLTKAQIIAAKL